MRVRKYLKTLLVGSGIGVLFATFYAIARPTLRDALYVLAAGAFTGMCISLTVMILACLFDTRIERLAKRWRVAAKSVQFLVGGLTGWTVGMLASSQLFGFGFTIRNLFSSGWVFSMIVAGAIALIVGFSFYGYELLQLRLERMVVQLKEREWAEKELELARSIQTRLLPPPLVTGDGFTIAARNLAASFVAGDFYDVVPLDDGSVVIVAADVAGKGVGASLIMASVKAVLPFVAREGAQRAMSMLNEKLVHELGRREFVALAYARFQPRDGSVELANAGFPEPYLLSSSGVRAVATSGERLPLGVRAAASYEPLTLQLEQGERLVFLSDGIPEAPVRGEPLGYERVADMLANFISVDDFLDRVRAVVDEGLADDWTAVVLERA